MSPPTTPTTPISDHARRTARRIAALLLRADALLITAGAGTCVDSCAPHDGYRRLHSWAQAMPGGSFVVTTSIDGQFLQAGFTEWQIVERHGGGLSDRAARQEQQRRFESWLAGIRGQRLVIIECGAGAGAGAAAVRRVGERLLERSFVSLVRIHPTATEADEPIFVLRLPVPQAIKLIHDSLPSVFGGADAARVPPESPPIKPIESPLRIELAPVNCVDLGSGLSTLLPLSVDDLGNTESRAFLERYGEAQSGWVQVPPCGGLEAPGCTMTARVMRAGDAALQSTVGAAIVFVQAPDGVGIVTYGIGRRQDEAATLWQMLYEGGNARRVALDYPRLPWLARRPEAGLADHPSILPYLVQFERVLLRSYLPFLAFIDAAQRRQAGGGS